MEPFSFTDDMKQFFRASAGAGSVVTEKDEAKKSQITITKLENTIISQYFDGIPTGSKNSLIEKGINPEVTFRRYPDGEYIQLVLLHPKPSRTELRIYMKANIFKPKAGLIWFVFVREGEIWIGAQDEVFFAAISNGIKKPSMQETLLDFADDEYQIAFHNSAVPEVTEHTVKRIKRDPKVAREALKSSGYICEMHPDLPLFNSRRDKMPYLEAHHLIPIGIQPQFEKSLDVKDNICILNPYSHRMLHHASFDEIEGHLKALSARREGFLNAMGVDISRILAIYGSPAA